jgi:hypothetical protein
MLCASMAIGGSVDGAIYRDTVPADEFSVPEYLEQVDLGVLEGAYNTGVLGGGG